MTNEKETKDLEAKSKSTTTKAPKAKAAPAPVTINKEVEKPADGSETKSTKKESWFNRKLLPFMGKLGNQRHLAAIRDSFGTLLPLVLAGAIGVLATTIVFGGWGSENVSVLGLFFIATHWSEYQALPDGGSIIWNIKDPVTGATLWSQGPWDEISTIGVQIFAPLNSVTLGIMSIYIAFLMGYFVGISRAHKTPIIVGLAGLATFGILINMSTYFVAANGLLIAILGGIAGAELFMVFTNVRALEIRLPDGVPPAVGKSFAVFLPMIFTLAIFSMFNTGIWAIANYVTESTVNANKVSVLSLYTTIQQNGFSVDMLTQPGYFGWSAQFIADDGSNIGEVVTVTYYELLTDTGNASAILDDEAAMAQIISSHGFTGLNTLAPKGSDAEAFKADATALLNEWIDAYDIMFMSVYTNAQTVIDIATANAANAANDLIITGAFEELATIASNYSNEAVSLAIGQVLEGTNGVGASGLAVNWDHTAVKYDGDVDQVATSIIVIDYVTVTVPTSSFGFGALIYLLIQAPFVNLVNSDAGLLVAMLYLFLVSFVWFFGIHGTNVMNGIFNPIWSAVLLTNLEIFQSIGNPEIAADYMGTFGASFFDAYAFIGGAGASLALLVGVLAVSKRRDLKEISKYAAPAGVFQINEPVTFGFPIVLNFVWLVPFTVAPILIITWATFGVESGLVYPSYIPTPWTAPWFLGALISNGFQSPFWSLFFAIGAFIIAFFTWLPFILIDNSIFNKKRRAEGNASPEEIALWDGQQYVKHAVHDIEQDVENGIITEDQKAALVKEAKADYAEMMPVLKAQYLAWHYYDKLEYKEKQIQEHKELKELQAAMRIAAQEEKDRVREAKKAEKLAQKANK